MGWRVKSPAAHHKIRTISARTFARPGFLLGFDRQNPSGRQKGLWRRFVRIRTETADFARDTLEMLQQEEVGVQRSTAR
jgi:hypothetical protein